MGKKIYDDEKLKSEALELRRQGLTYREIAKKLGCSIYKVHELISKHESPRSRLKQAIELADKLDELASKINTLETQISKLQSSLSNVKMLEDLTSDVLKLKEDMELIRLSAKRRLRDDSDGCKWVDIGGYCTFWYWSKEIEGWKMRPEMKEGKTVYRLNVKKHPLICTACPSYMPRGY